MSYTPTHTHARWQQIGLLKNYNFWLIKNNGLGHKENKGTHSDVAKTEASLSRQSF